MRLFSSFVTVRFVCLLVVTCGSMLSAEPQNLRITGVLSEIAYSNNPADKVVRYKREYSFEADLCSDGRYLILVDSGMFVLEESVDEKGRPKLVLHDDPKKDGRSPIGKQRAYLGYDQGMVVESTTRPNLPKKFGSENPRVAARALVNAGPFPWDISCVNIGLLWLAYGSSDFWREHEAIDVLPSLPLMPKQRDSALSFGWDWDLLDEMSSGSLMLPKSLSCVRNSAKDLNPLDPFDNIEVNSGEFNADMTRDDMHELFIQQIRTLKQSAKDGFVRTQYEAPEWGESNGFSFPLRFLVSSYRTSNPEYPKYIYEGHVRSYKKTKMLATYLPPVGNIISVIDSRFRTRNGTRSIEGLKYSLEDGKRWPRADDRVLVENFEGRKGNLSRKGSMGSSISVRLVFWVLIALVFFGLPIYSLRRKKSVSATKRG